MDNENCGTCRFSRVVAREDGTGNNRFCHRYPPTVLLDISGGGGDSDVQTEPGLCVQPFVDGDDWCGEYKPKAN